MLEAVGDTLGTIDCHCHLDCHICHCHTLTEETDGALNPAGVFQLGIAE
jgi:hypothetical protein